MLGQLCIMFYPCVEKYVNMKSISFCLVVLCLGGLKPLQSLTNSQFWVGNNNGRLWHGRGLCCTGTIASKFNNNGRLWHGRGLCCTGTIASKFERNWVAESDLLISPIKNHKIYTNHMLQYPTCKYISKISYRDNILQIGKMKKEWNHTQIITDYRIFKHYSKAASQSASHDWYARALPCPAFLWLSVPRSVALRGSLDLRIPWGHAMICHALSVSCLWRNLTSFPPDPKLLWVIWPNIVWQRLSQITWTKETVNSVNIRLGGLKCPRVSD